MNTQHRGPLFACLVLTVACGLFLGNALRTQGIIDVITATERYASHAAVAVPIRLDLDLAGQAGAAGRPAPAPATASVDRPVRVAHPVIGSRPVHVQPTPRQDSRPTAPVRHAGTRVAKGHQKPRHQKPRHQAQRKDATPPTKARKRADSLTRTATRTVVRVATRTVAMRIAAPAPVKVHGPANGHHSQSRGHGSTGSHGSGKAQGPGRAQGKARGHGGSRNHGAAMGHRKHH